MVYIADCDVTRSVRSVQLSYRDEYREGEGLDKKHLRVLPDTVTYTREFRKFCKTDEAAR